ncbi:MAG: TonB family protein [Pseudomonas sp.]
MISSMHAIGLWLLATTLRSEPVAITPPAFSGVLVSDTREPNRSEPSPAKPPAAVPQPPLRRRQKAAEASLSRSVAQSSAPAEPAAEPAVEESPLPSQAQDNEEPPQPVVPPRADAAFLDNPAPSYPPLSRRLREQGRVLLDVFILADGSVGQIKLKQSSGHPRLDDAALAAVRRWRYTPARRGATAIDYWHVQPLDFELDK